jgi:hypothetical protein
VVAIVVFKVCRKLVVPEDFRRISPGISRHKQFYVYVFIGPNTGG